MRTWVLVLALVLSPVVAGADVTTFDQISVALTFAHGQVVRQDIVATTASGVGIVATGYTPNPQCAPCSAGDLWAPNTSQSDSVIATTTYQGVTYYGGVDWEVTGAPVQLPAIAAGFSFTESIDFRLSVYSIPGRVVNVFTTGIATFDFTPDPNFPAQWSLTGGSYVIDTVPEPTPWLLVLTAGGLAWLAYRRPS